MDDWASSPEPGAADPISQTDWPALSGLAFRPKTGSKTASKPATQNATQVAENAGASNLSEIKGEPCDKRLYTAHLVGDDEAESLFVGAEKRKRALDATGKPASTVCFQSPYDDKPHHHHLKCDHVVCEDHVLPCGANCMPAADGAPKAKGQFLQCRECAARKVLGVRFKPEPCIFLPKNFGKPNFKPPKLRLTRPARVGEDGLIDLTLDDEIESSKGPGLQQPSLQRTHNLRGQKADASQKAAKDPAEEWLIKSMQGDYAAMPKTELSRLFISAKEGIFNDLPRKRRTAKMQGDSQSAKSGTHSEYTSGPEHVDEDLGREYAMEGILRLGRHRVEHNVATGDFDEEETHCVCESPADEFMLECAQCAKAFHPGCLGKGNFPGTQYECDEEERADFFKQDHDKYRATDKELTCLECDEKAKKPEPAVPFRRSTRLNKSKPECFMNPIVDGVSQTQAAAELRAALSKVKGDKKAEAEVRAKYEPKMRSHEGFEQAYEKMMDPETIKRRPRASSRSSAQGNTGSTGSKVRSSTSRVSKSPRPQNRRRGSAATTESAGTESAPRSAANRAAKTSGGEDVEMSDAGPTAGGMKWQYVKDEEEEVM